MRWFKRMVNIYNKIKNNIYLYKYYNIMYKVYD